MKRFIYCQSTDGGMDTEEFSFNENEDITSFPILGWMKPYNIDDDVKLLIWANKAKVGDYFHHRMGTIFRVNNIEWL